MNYIKENPMFEEQRKVLNMLAEGKIDTDQAEKLLAAIGQVDVKREASAAVSGTSKPKFLKIVVNPKEGHNHKDRVNIKIPIMLIKAGIKLGSVLPEHSRDKIGQHLKAKGLDIDLGKLDSESLDNLLQALKETSIDVEDDHETVKIFCD